MLRSTLILLSCATAYAQLSEKATWAAEAQNRYMVKPNITYGVQNNFETKLDVYQRRDTTGPQPTIIFIHGGGWTGGLGRLYRLRAWTGLSHRGRHADRRGGGGLLADLLSPLGLVTTAVTTITATRTTPPSTHLPQPPPRFGGGEPGHGGG